MSSEPDVLDDALAEMAGELLPAKDVATDEIPEPSDLEPQVLSFIDQIVDRAKGTGLLPQHRALPRSGLRIMAMR